MTIYKGPKKGFAQNFLSLASKKSIKSSLYCFCDQDDIWIPEKLEKAIEKIDKNEKFKIPILYGGRTIYIDENKNRIGFSPLFKKEPKFNNALVQNIAGGNTMVF